MMKALSSDPLASATEATRPRTISEKYSAAPNSRATAASGGAKSARIIVATVRAAEGGYERLRAPGRRCPSHLLHLCPWRRGLDGDLPVPRPRPVGQERGGRVRE